MKEALEVLRIIEKKGFLAYIVGGYVRDYCLKRESLDIDICTNATPKDILDIFDNVLVDDKQYGAVKVYYQGNKYDITTFRKDIKYVDNRRPIKIKYVNDLKTDLLRRDFTINTLCIDKNGKIIDLLNVKNDLYKKVIKTVGNPRYRIKEDALRILRAIRFATTLDFDIDEKTKFYIKKYGYLLKKLSYTRKKEELMKIFASINKAKGIDLLLELGLHKHLEITKLTNNISTNNVIGIWSILEVDDKYPFSKLEREQMRKIRQLLQLELFDSYNIYSFGLYLSTIVADIKQLDKKKLNLIYNSLPIYNRRDIVISPVEVANILKKKPDKYLTEIFNDIEKKIIYKTLNNNKNDIIKYCLKKYGGDGNEK
ncbi:MAG: hypothetical protein Q4G04_03560 [bacterium]|nr:hypothetical protein [bacterium]